MQDLRIIVEINFNFAYSNGGDSDSKSTYHLIDIVFLQLLVMSKKMRRKKRKKYKIVWEYFP